MAEISEKSAMRRPRISRRILEGILTATSNIEAGGYQEFETVPDDVTKMELAQSWAAEMLLWMQKKQRKNGR